MKPQVYSPRNNLDALVLFKTEGGCNNINIIVANLQSSQWTGPRWVLLNFGLQTAELAEPPEPAEPIFFFRKTEEQVIF